MTVASLWKALDEAGCGRPVGVEEIRNPFRSKKTKTNPWKHKKDNRSTSAKRPAYAVDLSIWICESLTSTAMAGNHANPALHLVFTRTMRLLNMGVKLIVVVEGKQRTRQSDEDGDGLRKRRSGTAFWRACQTCEEMLRLLGVLVLRAEAEGEALCALLNQKGLVDGVISNDGDCFLFGAKVVYTKFSLENLEQSRVMRYDATNIKGVLADDDADDIFATKIHKMPNFSEGSIVPLSRNDLIAFAILTGSDLAGSGLPKVGARKAIRFIRKCQCDNPLKQDIAAIEELKSWAKVADRRGQKQLEDVADEKAKTETMCSCCRHPGNVRTHTKHGCALCGTDPGEPCFRLSQEGRFRKSLRDKALAMIPKFDPAFVVHAYNHPNQNQIPYSLQKTSARSLTVPFPKLGDFLKSSLLVKGHSTAESKSFLQASLCKLTARLQLLEMQDAISKSKQRQNPAAVTPIGIQKELVKGGSKCFDVKWKLTIPNSAGDTDASGGHEFQTIELKETIQKCFPEVVAAFSSGKFSRIKQGEAEQFRRRDFITSLLCDQRHPIDRSPPKKKSSRETRNRQDYFGALQGSAEWATDKPSEEKGLVSSRRDIVPTKSSSALENIVEKVDEQRSDGANSVPKVVMISNSNSLPPCEKPRFQYSEDIKKIMSDVLFASKKKNGDESSSIDSNDWNLDQASKEPEPVKRPAKSDGKSDLTPSIDFFLKLQPGIPMRPRHGIQLPGTAGRLEDNDKPIELGRLRTRRVSLDLPRPSVFKNASTQIESTCQQTTSLLRDDFCETEGVCGNCAPYRMTLQEELRSSHQHKALLRGETGLPLDSVPTKNYTSDMKGIPRGYGEADPDQVDKPPSQVFSRWDLDGPAGYIRKASTVTFARNEAEKESRHNRKTKSFWGSIQDTAAFMPTTYSSSVGRNSCEEYAFVASRTALKDFADGAITQSLSPCARVKVKARRTSLSWTEFQKEKLNQSLPTVHDWHQNSDEFRLEFSRETGYTASYLEGEMSDRMSLGLTETENKYEHMCTYTEAREADTPDFQQNLRDHVRDPAEYEPSYEADGALALLLHTELQVNNVVGQPETRGWEKDHVSHPQPIEVHDDASYFLDTNGKHSTFSNDCQSLDDHNLSGPDYFRVQDCFKGCVPLPEEFDCEYITTPPHHRKSYDNVFG